MILIEEYDPRFCLKKSTIPNAGMGVFAEVPIKTGDLMAITGVQLKLNSTAWYCADKQNLVGHYIFNWWDGYVIPLGIGGMVNHTPDPSYQNCTIVRIDGELYYKFIKDVAIGEEVFGHYGPNWREWL